MSLIDTSRLVGLSDKATLLIIRLIQDDFRQFTLAEILRFVAQKKMVGFSVNFMYAILAELVAAKLLTHEKAAPGKQAFYRFNESMSMSLNLSSSHLSKSNRNNDCACETLPNASPLSTHDTQAITTQAAKYGLTPAFLLEKVAERRAAGKPFDLTILETTLQVAKERATKDFAGLFFTMFVKRDVFASPYAQNTTQATRQPAQGVTKPAACIIEPVHQKTPYNANAAVVENLRQPVKSAEEQAAHYQQIADIPPEVAFAMDVQALCNGVKATKTAWQAGQLTQTQARTQIAAFLGSFAPDVLTAAETTIQDVMRAFDAPVTVTPPVSQERRGAMPGKLASMARGIGARA